MAGDAVVRCREEGEVLVDLLRVLLGAAFGRLRGLRGSRQRSEARQQPSNARDQNDSGTFHRSTQCQYWNRPPSNQSHRKYTRNSGWRPSRWLAGMLTPTSMRMCCSLLSDTCICGTTSTTEEAPFSFDQMISVIGVHERPNP